MLAIRKAMCRQRAYCTFIGEQETPTSAPGHLVKLGNIQHLDHQHWRPAGICVLHTAFLPPGTTVVDGEVKQLLLLLKYQ